MRWIVVVGVVAACGGPSTPEPEPTVTVEPSAGGRSGLTRNDVDRVVKSAKDRILACYQRELARVKDLGGKLVIAFTIDADGRVTNANVDEGSNLDSTNVEDCVLGEVRLLVFPPQGGAVVRYPFIFSAS